MCADQANEQSTKPDAYEFHVSHYDAKANVCYVMFYMRNMRAAFVEDAFEGRMYANFAKRTEVENCRVYSPAESAKPNRQCSSFREFQDLVEDYFGVSI